MEYTDSVRRVLLVFDASTFNPFKNFKTTKVRLKKKLFNQIKDQPRVLSLMADLKQGPGFVVKGFIPIVTEPWGHGDDIQILDKLEEIASENPGHLIIFITRDLGFCQESGWQAHLSRIYICVLPRKFLSKTIDQYSRLDMMYIISIDIINLLTIGQPKYSQLFAPAI